MTDDRIHYSKSLIDIYEAAGAKVNEDRSSVEIRSDMVMQPFDIVVRVFPTGVEYYGHSGKVNVRFSALLDTDFDFSEGPGGFGHRLEEFDHGFEIDIPADQVRILKKETDV